MDKLSVMKYLLALVLAAVFAIALFTVDATSYQNEFNQLDVKKAVYTFAGLWTAFTALLKMQPPGGSK